MKHSSKPIFSHHIPFYYDWGGYRIPVTDYGVFFKCRVRTHTRPKIYVRNFKLYPPKPRTPEEIEASESAFRKLANEGHWAASMWSADIWHRVQSTTFIYDAFSGRGEAK